MRRSIAAASLALASALLVASPSAAYAASYLDEAVQALQTGNVYVSLETRTIDAATKQRLEQQTQGTSIGVVILPEGARTEAGDLPHFVNQIALESTKETVVIAIGNDLEASGSNASKLANNLERSTPSTGDALVKFVTETRSVPPADSQQTQTGTDSGVLILAAVITGIVAAGLSIGYAQFKHRQRQRKPTHTNPAASTPILSEGIRAGLSALSAHDVRDPALMRTIKQCISDTERFFELLAGNKLDKIKQTEVSVAYELQLKRVNRVLGKYVDIQNYPNDYEDAAGLLYKGASAVQQYANGVRQNIRSIKSGSLTEFNVNIEMLSEAARRDNTMEGLE